MVVQLIPLFVVLLLAIGWWMTEPAVKAPGASVSFKYIVEYAGDADGGARLPMLIALHGNGDTPENFFIRFLEAQVIHFGFVFKSFFASSYPLWYALFASSAHFE